MTDEMIEKPQQEITQMKNKNILAETWDYLKIRKKYWLIPIIVLMLLVGLLIILSASGGAGFSPFIYAMF